VGKRAGLSQARGRRKMLEHVGKEERPRPFLGPSADEQDDNGELVEESDETNTRKGKEV
jgi:hypothetical protein